MYAIEFQASIKDGLIEVPDEYRHRFRGSVRVIVLSQEVKPEVATIEHLLNNPIKAPNFTPLKRDEIYQR